MSDYSKLNIRFVNYGWNIAHDPTTIDFGKYIRINNLVSDLEGRLTSRPGLTAMSNVDITPGSAPIIGVRRLNDAVQNESTYVIRAGTKLYVTTDGGGALTTTTPFNYTLVQSGFSSQFGSIYLDRTARSSQAWAYVGDANKMVKVAQDPASNGIIIKNVGITRPAGPITSLTATVGGSQAKDTYSYRYTYFDNNTGVESKFNSNETVQSIDIDAPNNAVAIVIPADAGLDTAVTHVRIYRKSTTLTSWRLLSALTTAYTGASITVTDLQSDTAIASATLMDVDSDKPFVITDNSGNAQPGTAMKYLFGPIFGYMLACGDATNPGVVYWSKKFNPDGHDPADYVDVTTPHDPLMGGLIYDGKPFVFSKEGLYTLIVGFGNNTFTPFKTPCGRGLFFESGYAVGPEIYFMAKDGIYATSGGQERLLSGDELRPLFNDQSLYGYSPVDFTGANKFCRMAYFERELYVQYRGQDGATYFLVYDLAYKRWRFMNFRIGTECMYVDEESASNLILGSTGSLNGGRLFTHSGFDDETANIEYPVKPITIPTQLTSQFVTLGSPLIHKEFGALIVDLDPKGATVSVSAYTDKGATLVNTGTYTDATRSRKFLNLGNTFAEDIQIDVSWASSTVAPILYGYELLYRPDAVQLERWSIKGVTHGLQGWQILRSGYIMLRSDGTVTFQVTADGTQYTYTIASTSGEKRKIFIPFDPIKGKVFDYTLSLGTATYFRLYNNQCEMHVKPWITSFGYSVVNPFVGEGGTVIASNTNPQDTGIPSGATGGSPVVGNPAASKYTNFIGGGSQLTPAVAMPQESTESGLYTTPTTGSE